MSDQQQQPPAPPHLQHILLPAPLVSAYPQNAALNTQQGQAVPQPAPPQLPQSQSHPQPPVLLSQSHLAYPQPTTLTSQPTIGNLAANTPELPLGIYKALGSTLSPAIFEQFGPSTKPWVHQAIFHPDQCPAASRWDHLQRNSTYLGIVGSTQPVYKIFGQDHFHLQAPEAGNLASDHLTSLSITAYTHMIPALRLASIFMERSQDVLMAIYSAPIEYDMSGKPHLSKGWRPDTASRADFNRALDYLGDTTKFCMTSHVPESKCEDYCAYNMAVINPAMVETGSDFITYRIGILADVFQAFKRPNFFQIPLEQRTCLQVLFAVTLVHQFCHILFRHRARSEAEIVWLRDAHFPLPEDALADPMTMMDNSEIGDLWEYNLFGGSIRPKLATGFNFSGQMQIDAIADGSQPLYLTVKHASGRGMGVYKIAANSLLRMMLSESWQQDSLVRLLLTPEDAPWILA